MSRVWFVALLIVAALLVVSPVQWQALAATRAATPTYSPKPGTYTGLQPVTISDTAPDATIYYTTDGTTPTTSSAVYTAPIDVSVATTIKAIATAPGYTKSAVAIGVYKFKAAKPANWSMFAFGPAHTSYNPYETTLDASNVSSVTQAFASNNYFNNPCWLPAVVDGVIYAGRQAWSAADGTPLWSDSFPVYCSIPAVANGVVYEGAANPDNNLYALNAADGTVKWKAPTGDYIGSSPAVVGNVAYVGSHDGNVYAFNALTGKLKWKTSVNAAIQFSSPAVVNGVVYIGNQSGDLYALNAANGKVIWTGTGLGDYSSSPVVVNGVVYSSVVPNGTLYAINASDGSVKWSQPGFGGGYCTPAVANGVVYAMVGSCEGVGQLAALNAADGSVKWQSSVTSGVILQGIVVANGVIYGGGAWGVWALSAADGSLLYHNGDTTWYAYMNSIVVVDGTLYYMHTLSYGLGVEAYQLPTS